MAGREAQSSYGLPRVAPAVGEREDRGGGRGADVRGWGGEHLHHLGEDRGPLEGVFARLGLGGEAVDEGDGGGVGGGVALGHDGDRGAQSAGLGDAERGGGTQARDGDERVAGALGGGRGGGGLLGDDDGGADGVSVEDGAAGGKVGRLVEEEAARDGGAGLLDARPGVEAEGVERRRGEADDGGGGGAAHGGREERGDRRVLGVRVRGRRPGRGRVEHRGRPRGERHVGEARLEAEAAEEVAGGEVRVRPAAVREGSQGRLHHLGREHRGAILRRGGEPRQRCEGISLERGGGAAGEQQARHLRDGRGGGGGGLLVVSEVRDEAEHLSGRKGRADPGFGRLDGRAGRGGWPSGASARWVGPETRGAARAPARSAPRHRRGLRWLRAPRR